MKDKSGLFVFMLAAAGLFFSCEQYPGISNTVGYEPEAEPEAEDEGEPEAQIIGIKIISPPEMTVYGRNQTFSSAGLEVGWLYDDDSVDPMEDDEWLLDSEPDMTKYTVHKVTVKAAGHEDDDAYQDSFWIDIMNSDRVLQSITVSGPTKKVQDLGFDFDKTGLVVTGHFSDGSTSNLASFASVTGYSRKWRGEQTLTAKVNGKTATFTVTTRIGTQAYTAVNQIQWRYEDYQNKCYRPTRIKGEGLNLETANVKIIVNPNGNGGLLYSASNSVTLSYGPGGLTDADFSTALAAYNPNQPGAQSVSFTVDGRNFTLDIFVIDTEPDVWFDYGYMRHAGDSTGHGPGAGKYYARTGETLVIAPVRYLVGYDANHNAAAGTTYNWTVSGDNNSRTYTTSNNGELLHVTPKTAGTYTIEVTVGGTTYLGGSFSKTINAELVCYSAALPAGTFVSPLRNFACGQMTEGGTGLGWSLGSAGGYEVWTVEHRSSYRISGNAFSAWHEAGIVWMQEDRNGNGLPDEMWYELRGGDDDDPEWKNKITRRYAVTYIKGAGNGTKNEYGQLIRAVYWADSRGRSHIIPGGFPDAYWGVEGNRVTYTCTLLRDDGNIATSNYSGLLFSTGGYVDALGETFYTANAMRADGAPVTLSAVKFIKVQTAVFRYGADFGDVSTEIHSADFLGSQTDFPLP